MQQSDRPSIGAWEVVWYEVKHARIIVNFMRRLTNRVDSH